MPQLEAMHDLDLGRRAVATHTDAQEGDNSSIHSASLGQHSLRDVEPSRRNVWCIAKSGAFLRRIAER